MNEEQQPKDEEESTSSAKPVRMPFPRGSTRPDSGGRELSTQTPYGFSTEPKGKGSAGKGFVIQLICNAVHFGGGLLSIGYWLYHSEILPWLFFGIGLSQALYVVPIALYFWRKGETRTVAGMLIMACVTFLLNAICFGGVWLG